MIQTVRHTYIVGTNHGYQRGEQRKQEFDSFLLKVCYEFGIQLIAEEINVGAKLIVARDIANRLGIGHLIIDPSPSQYEEYGIKRINRIYYEVTQLFDLDSLPDPVDSNTAAARELDLRILEQHSSPREKVWLSRIEIANIWPTLVICGANHVFSFSKLLNHSEIQTSVVEHNWG